MSRIPGVLAAVAFLGAAIAASVTIGWDGAFPPPVPGTFDAALAEARGWSAVTLLLAIPLGITALVATRLGSVRGQLALTGVLAYLAYTYLEMAVSPPFSALYLVYVATFATAGAGALATSFTVDNEPIDTLFARAPRISVAVFSFLFAAGLSLAWLSDIVPRTLSGDFGYPTGTAAIGHVVHALDLGIFVPLGIASGAMLLARHPAAWHVAAVTLAMAACMAPALTAMVGVSLATQGESLLGDIPFVVLALVAVGLTAWSFAVASAPELPQRRLVPEQGREPTPHLGEMRDAVG